jgi:hypothetical protein
MKYFKTGEIATVESYSYGHLRAQAFFGLEFKPKKGFRSTFQTINPKTGKANKIKFGTYAPLMIMIEKENGHISYIGGDFNGSEAINRDAKTVFDNFDLFTPEQIEYFYLHILLMLKVEARAMVVYCGADFEKVKPILNPIIDICVQGTKTKTNLFDKINIEIQALNACKVPGFNPFRVVEYADVTANKLNNPVVTQISDHDKRNGETIETVQAGENVKVLVNNTLGYYNVKES